MNALLLSLSIILSSLRNILSKSISDLVFGTRQFFLTQAVIFCSGSLVLLLVSGSSFIGISSLTILYAAIYGILLLSAQYCYTAALKNGNIGICSTVYSLGFIFPTLSGSIFWREELSALNLIGILIVIPTIIISGMSPSKNASQGKVNKYIFPLVIAMLSSGGLGIMQKVQQNSPFPEQRGAFIILAFALAGIISFLIAVLAKPAPKRAMLRKIFAG